MASFAHKVFQAGAVIGAFAFAGCTDQLEQRDRATAESHIAVDPRRPARVGMVLDGSGSAERYGVRPPSADQVRDLLLEVRHGGGEFAVFWIRESGKTRGPLVYLPSPAPAPQAPRAARSMTARANQLAMHEKKFEGWKQEEEERLRRCSEIIERFLTGLRPELESPSKARQSAVIEALSLATRFLDAPAAAGEEPHRLLIVVSDGISSGREAPVAVKMSQTAAVLWANSSLEKSPVMEALRPQLFLDAGQLIRHATTLLRGGGAAPQQSTRLVVSRVSQKEEQ